MCRTPIFLLICIFLMPNLGRAVEGVILTGEATLAPSASNLGTMWRRSRRGMILSIVVMDGGRGLRLATASITESPMPFRFRVNLSKKELSLAQSIQVVVKACKSHAPPQDECSMREPFLSVSHQFRPPLQENGELELGVFALSE